MNSSRSNVYSYSLVQVALGGFANFFIVLSLIANVGIVFLIAATYVCM